MIFVSQARNGDRIEWRDKKRYLWIISVLAPAVPALGALLMVWSGNPLWSALAVVFYYGFIPLADTVVGEDPNNPPVEILDQLTEDRWYRILLFAAVAIQWISFAITFWVIGTVAAPWWSVLLLTIGLGIASGSSLTVGHELGHKPHRLDRWGAKLACALTGYAHFCIEHNRGHHVMVATPEDPASSKYGESLWAFVLREIPGAARRGWACEKQRLAKKNLPFLHWRNDLLQGYAIALAVGMVLVLSFGLFVLPLLVLHHSIGWFNLTLANYVEHYGLMRERLPNGKFGPCEPHHSWNTNHIVSNLFLFHLQRHSDHHANPLRPYQALRNFDRLPQLPSGYPGSFLLALFPPLWFKVMNPKVLAWAEGDLNRINRL